ncbi:PapD-like protein [Mycena albidolilacea]|uniref:PapD-like protein n=1 Tax=Mycena albidolilacea TaxID=1033008 RepID=A0AAD7AS41_9AGAR|nr:PapD-like protein [Mycena albidolilacea]
MSVSLTPSNALGFNRPLTSLVKRSLTITNHNAQPVAFKVKTTAPKLYCVRPNSGRVEPGQSVDVSVMLQPLKEEPPLNAKCKDKFLIQSTLITPGKEAMSLAEIWSSPDAGEDGKVHQQKLRVVYLPAEGQTLVEEDEEGQATQSSMIVGDSRFDTVRQHPSANGETAPNPIPSALRPSTPPADFSNAQEEPHEEIQPSFDAPGVIVTPPQVSVSEREAKPAPEEPALAPVPVVVSTPAPAPAPPVTRTQSIPTPASLPAALPPTDDYAVKYADAHAEIERLRKLLAESQPPAELRRRTRKLSDSTAVDVAVLEEAAIQEGVPLQVVVIIALGVFITTYLFF